MAEEETIDNPELAEAAATEQASNLAGGAYDVLRNRRQGLDKDLRERLEKATIIVVSHQAETLERFCRSAAVLRDGQFYQFDTLEEAKRLYEYDA